MQSIAATKHKISLGIFGETIAERYLRDEGYAILARRWRTRLGEIDIVAWKDGWLAFVEVKTRTSSAYGRPEEAVTPRKRLRLRRAVHAYLRAKDALGKPFRIDVIAVIVPRSGKPAVRHLRSAVGEE